MLPIDPFVISTTAATALGAYNIARFVASSAIQKRRKVKETKQLVRDVKDAVSYAKELHGKLLAGEVDKQKVQDAIAVLKNLTTGDKAAA